MSRTFVSRTLVAILAAVIILSHGARLAAQDALGQVRERERIAAQKLQADVTYAVAESRVLERANPSRAAELLQDTLTKVRSAVELPADERARLVQRLQTRLREVNVAIQERTRNQDDAAARADQKARQEAREREQFAGGRANPAPPSQGPASVAAKVFEARSAQIANADRNKGDRAARNMETLASLQKSATPISGAVEYPTYWERIIERSKPKLTEKEVGMLRALNSVLSVDFDKTKLSKVLDFLQEKAGLTILVDEPSLKDVNVDLYEDTVTFKVSKVTVRTILRKLLADRGLSYVLKDGMVQVVTQEKARQTMVVRAYPVSDLVAIDNQLFWGPVFSRALMLQNAQRIMDMIQGSVEPSQWNTNGGPGSISFHEPSMALVIRASAEMHYMFGGQGMVSR